MAADQLEGVSGDLVFGLLGSFLVSMHGEFDIHSNCHSHLVADGKTYSVYDRAHHYVDRHSGVHHSTFSDSSYFDYGAGLDPRRKTVDLDIVSSSRLSVSDSVDCPIQETFAAPLGIFTGLVDQTMVIVAAAMHFYV